MTFDHQAALEGAIEIFNKILIEYSQSRYVRRLEIDEYPSEDVCNNCKGCGIFKNEDGESKECFQNREEGDCFKVGYDYGLLGLEVETLLPKICDFMVSTEPEQDIQQDLFPPLTTKPKV
jgi:hypothetical protein